MFTDSKCFINQGRLELMGRFRILEQIKLLYTAPAFLTKKNVQFLLESTELESVINTRRPTSQLTLVAVLFRWTLEETRGVQVLPYNTTY